ncbi:MAG: hypothetical protein PHG64_11550, partial [Paludibacter sp.]|nr:hypothetical protein [Paludibacter sp.]
KKQRMRYRLTINFCIVEWHIPDKKQILSFQQSTAPNTAQATPPTVARPGHPLPPSVKKENLNLSETILFDNTTVKY